jgi:hypothetical protein
MWSASRKNARRRHGTLRLVAIILGVLLGVAAVAGGIALDRLFWLLLILALVVFAIGALTGRITE